MNQETDLITNIKPPKNSKKAIIFYAFVILLSLAIIVATILIAYRYFYGPFGDDDKIDYATGRSKLLDNVDSELGETSQNIIAINGLAVEGYENAIQNSNLATISNVTGNQLQIVDMNSVNLNSTNNLTVNDTNVIQNSNINENTQLQENINQEEIAEFPAHDFDKNLLSLLPKYNENTKDKVKGVYSSDEKQVFLTFDDGPSNITNEVLDVLKKYNVKATFFVLGSNVDLKPEITKRAYEEGHYIANHGYSHKYSSIYANPRNVIEEYERTEKSIQNAIGISNYHSYLFRFPGGSSGGYYDSIKSEARDLLDEYGVAYTNWSCLTGDAEGNTTVESQLRTLYESAGDDTSLVILMHDAGDKKATPQTLEKIIELYQKEGYVFKTYYDIMK